jgi:hypothetical protein
VLEAVKRFNPKIQTIVGGGAPNGRSRTHTQVLRTPIIGFRFCRGGRDRVPAVSQRT